MTPLTIARLTLREAARSKVVRELHALTVVLLALSACGFSKLVGLDTDLCTMTSDEARPIASRLVMVRASMSGRRGLEKPQPLSASSAAVRTSSPHAPRRRSASRRVSPAMVSAVTGPAPRAGGRRAAAPRG